MAVEFKDYYRILGVDRNADEKTIKAAYRRLARRYHPDVAKTKDAAERFKEINEAYEVLSDPEKRRRYDSLGPDWERFAKAGRPGEVRVEYGPGDLGDFSEFFRTIFGDLGVRVGRAGRAGRGFGLDLEDLFEGRPFETTTRPRARDLEAPVEITLEEAFHGARKTLTLDVDEPCAACGGTGRGRGQPCPTCDGRGTQRTRRQLDVKIPAGIKTGQRVRVAGEGAGAPGQRGDLYLTVTVRPHPLFQREGDDVVIELPLTAPEAALGTTVEVPTLKGKVSMRIPPGTPSGRTFRLPGYGMPRVKGGGQGDQLVRIKIVVPADLTPAERELYQRLQALRPENPRAALG